MGKLSAEFVQGYRDRYEAGDCPIFDSFNGLGYVVYKRTYARPINETTSEEWPDTIERAINGAIEIGADFSQAEAERLFDHMYNLRGFVGGRMLWQLGTANNTRLGGDSLVNCWFVDIQKPADFGFLFEELMLGGGVGFNTLNAPMLGTVRAGSAVRLDGFDVDLVVADNRQGWRTLLVRVIEAHFSGETFTYSVDGVRPEGAPISTFGGTASGPGILVSGVERIQEVLIARDGQQLRPIDVLDIGNLIGDVVVSGNVRRSAEIALGSASDEEYLKAKDWGSGVIPQHRAMSNNSVYVDHPSYLPDSFWDGYQGNGEAYGMVNLRLLRSHGRTGEFRPDPSISGVNPCAEIGLASYESCNLAEIVLPRIESSEQLEDVSFLLYKVQKAVAAMPYLHPQTEKVVHKNMRLGLGITGAAQASEEQLGWLDGAYRALREADASYSPARDLPESVRLTTVKPSGTLSLVAGVTPGGHPGFSRFHLRRVRMSASDPLVNWCRARGYHVEFQQDFEGKDDPRTVVVEFPVELPEGTWFADGGEASAVAQLNMLRFLQRNWSDNAVSVTVYYRLEELPEIRAYLDEHWRDIKSVSFLLHEDHGYNQAPLEAISEDRYHELVHALSHAHAAEGVSSLALDDEDCATGACPIR